MMSEAGDNEIRFTHNKPMAATPISRLRAGVIGAGFIGPVQIEALKRLGIQVTSICDFDARKATAAAEKWNIPLVYTGEDYHKLIASDQVDVVHITTPNRFHHSMSLAALRGGKHCLCEKPLAMNSRETAAIAQLASRLPQVFAVGYNIRFYPAVLQLRRAIARGDLGQIIHVHGSYFQDWLLKDTDYNWRLLPSEGGKLRAVADIGTHWMDTASFMLGSKISNVLACLGTYHQQRRRPLGEVQTFTKATKDQKYVSYPVETEDYATVMLQFANGVHGGFGVSQVAAGRKNCVRIEVYGSQRSACWNSEEPNMINYGSRDDGNVISVRNTPGFSEDIAGFTDYPAGHIEGFPDTFKMFYRHVYGAVAAGKPAEPLYATAEDGHWEVRVCEAILKSHQGRKWIKV
jgi:predicted dehydrogenase